MPCPEPLEADVRRCDFILLSAGALSAR